MVLVAGFPFCLGLDSASGAIGSVADDENNSDWQRAVLAGPTGRQHTNNRFDCCLIFTFYERIEQFKQCKCL